MSEQLPEWQRFELHKERFHSAVMMTKNIHHVAVSRSGSIDFERTAFSHLNTILRHCLAMAHMACYKRKLPTSAMIDRDDIILEAVENSIIRRGPDGSLMLLKHIFDLWNKNADPAPNDSFGYFRCIIETAVSYASRKAVRKINPEYFHIAQKLDACISSCSRFIRDGAFIIDAHGKLKDNHARCISGSELASAIRASDAPRREVDSILELIFNHLLDHPSYANRIAIGELRRGVYSIMCPGHQTVDVDDPNYRESISAPSSDAGCEKDLEFARKLAISIVDETRRSYRWNAEFPPDVIDAFCAAAKDMAIDKVDTGERQYSLRAYLAMHIPNCSQESYRTKYKACFQSFVKVIDKKWGEKTAKLFPA
ncbi:MAG: hypothetical protein C4574_03825 [Candidatus Latescibacterota bacterium]|jgi:hypothetical protein|nr:MAG: hypothetical protein C4574_03825 [Candidatus Latescibacterota bacterium]